MGYTTEFEGNFVLDAPLTEAQRIYLLKFSNTRRMKRNVDIAAKMPDPERAAVDLPIGEEASYFVGGGGFAGQDRDASIVEYSYSPGTVSYGSAGKSASWAQPGLWCQWVPTEDGTALEWNGAEKFYDYKEWLQYLIDHFLKRWGRSIVSGKVTWQGEEDSDRGVLRVVDGKVLAAEKVGADEESQTELDEERDGWERERERMLRALGMDEWEWERQGWKF